MAGIEGGAELNELFTAWVETVYPHHCVHSETGQSPLARFSAADPPVLPCPAQLHEAFLWSEPRAVTKTATVSLHSNTCEVDTFAALDQRIALRCAMTPMSDTETKSYLAHHLGLAGRSDTLLSDDAVAMIHQVARGIPRTVDNLAVQSLVAAFATSKPSSSSRRDRQHPSPGARSPLTVTALPEHPRRRSSHDHNDVTNLRWHRLRPRRSAR